MNRAAFDAGLTQAQLVVQLVTVGAQRIVKGEAEPAAGPPPAVVNDRLAAQDEVLRLLTAKLEALGWRNTRSPPAA